MLDTEKGKVSEIMDYIEKNNAILLSRLCDAIAFRGDTAEDYFSHAVNLYKKYNQGSHSFTKTKLRHVGWDHPEEVWDAIYYVLHLN